MDKFSAALGAEVRAEVAALAYTTKQVEERLGLSYSAYRRYFITGDRSPSVATLRAVALGLGMTAIELLDKVEARLKRESAAATQPAKRSRKSVKP